MQDLDELISGTNGDVVVRLSTASLTSSSSSGSGSEPRIVKTPQRIPELTTQLSSNGRLNSDTTDGRAAPSNSKPFSATGAIPKSISFDMTAERGDKEMLDDDGKGKGNRGFFGKLKMSLRNRRGKPVRGEDMGRCYERDLGSDGALASGEGGRHRLRRIMSEDVTSTCSVNSGSSTLSIFLLHRCFSSFIFKLK